MKRVPATTIAGFFALAAFAVAIVAGLASGNAAQSVLTRALLAMIVCYPIGFAVGLIALQLVNEHIDVHRAAHPTDEVTEPTESPAQEVDEHGQPTDEEVLTV